MYTLDKTKSVNIRLTEKELEELETMSNERKIFLSELIRYILKDYIRKFKKTLKKALKGEK